jgi:hypothetical protein
LAACEQLEIPLLGAEAQQAVQSDVPALLLSGQFDPITPEQNALTVLEGLSQGQAFTVANAGHGVVFDMACAREMMGEFLANPTAVVADRCTDIEPLDCLTPDEVLPNPFLLNLNMNLGAWDEGQMSFMDAVGSLLWLIVTAGVLVTALFVWPILALIEQSRQPTTPTNDPEINIVLDPNSAPAPRRPAGWVRAQGWVLIAAVFVALFILFGLVAIVVLTYSVAPEVTLFGFVPEVQPFFLLPWLMFGLTAVLIVGLFGAWAQRAWSIGRRIYFTLMVITAGSFAYTLWQLGLY